MSPLRPSEPLSLPEFKGDFDSAPQDVALSGDGDTQHPLEALDALLVEEALLADDEDPDFLSRESEALNRIAMSAGWWQPERSHSACVAAAGKALARRGWQVTLHSTSSGWKRTLPAQVPGPEVSQLRRGSLTMMGSFDSEGALRGRLSFLVRWVAPRKVNPRGPRPGYLMPAEQVEVQDVLLREGVPVVGRERHDLVTLTPSDPELWPWQQAGFTVVQALVWRRLNADLTEAKKQREKGISASTALRDRTG